MNGTTVADFLTTDNQMVLWEFLKDRLGIAWSTDLTCIGRVRDGKLLGVVGYNYFTGSSCQMHMAGDRGWMDRKFVRAAFHYPFETLGLTMVLGSVPSGNIRALEIDRRLGFEELTYIPGAHPDGGIHLLQLRRETWERSRLRSRLI